MSIFGYIYSSYLILLMVEIWLIYRPHCINKYHETTGLQQFIWRVLTLDVMTYHPESAETDRKIAIFLAGLGIPWAFTLHGYVGFDFGSVKAIAWWASPLQPIIFLMSAVVSGMAMLMVTYSFVKWCGRQPYDYVMIKKFMAFLWGIFLLDFVLGILEVVFTYYEHGHHWSLIGPLLNGPLWGTFVIGQILVLSCIPLCILGYVGMSNVKGKALFYLANLGSFMLVLQVLFMRYNTVIGGKLISKSERGFVAYDWELWGADGILLNAMLLAAPFCVYFLLSRVLPIFSDHDNPDGMAEQG